MLSRPNAARVAAFVAIATVTLTACDVAAPTAPLLDPTAARVAAAQISNEFQPLELLYGNACTGAVFLVTGRIHLVRTVTTDADGGYHATVHVNFQNASGIDQVSGVKYRVISTQAASFNVSAPGGGRVESTSQTVFKLVGQGPLNNFTFRTQSHLTVNANGMMTVSFSDTERSCG